MNEKAIVNKIFAELTQKDSRKEKVIRPKLREILWHKFVYWVDITTSREILIKILKTLIIISFIIALYFPVKSKELIIYLFYFKSFYFAKIISFSLLIIYCESLYSFCLEKYELIKINKEAKSREILEDNIEEKIIQLLIREKSFKQKFIPELGITQKDFHTWSKKLEKKNILIRGEKNSRVLNPKLSINELSSALYEIDELKIFNSREIAL